MEVIKIAKNTDIHIHPLDTKHVIGRRIISKNGKVIGSVCEINIHPENLSVLGVIAKCGWSKVYIGTSYIGKITSESVILNIDPSVFIKGKIVLSHSGKEIGKVRAVIRKENTNEVKEIVVKSFWRKDLVVPYSAIEFVNKSVMLSKNYNGKQKLLWQKN